MPSSSFPPGKAAVYIPPAKRKRQQQQQQGRGAAASGREPEAESSSSSFRGRPSSSSSSSFALHKAKKQQQRFHGAFTGGFSAGYFNTVDTKEGWKPSMEKNSSQSISDFMDDQDHEEWGGPTNVQKDYQEGQAKKSTANIRDSPQQQDRSAIAPPPLKGLESMLTVSHQTVGPRLLRVLGWREGQGSAFVPQHDNDGPNNRDSGNNANINATTTSTSEEGTLSKKKLRKIQLSSSRQRLPPPKLDACGLGFEAHEDAPEFRRYKEQRQAMARLRGQHQPQHNIYRASDLTASGTTATTTQQPRNHQDNTDNNSHNDNDNQYLSYEAPEDFVGKRSAAGFALRDDEDDAYDDDETTTLQSHDKSFFKVSGQQQQQPPPSSATSARRVVDSSNYHTEIVDIEHSDPEDDNNDNPSSFHATNTKHATRGGTNKSQAATTRLGSALSSWAITGATTTTTTTTTSGSSTAPTATPVTKATITTAVLSNGRPPIAGFRMGGSIQSSSSKQQKVQRYPGPDVPRDYVVQRHRFGPQEHPSIFQTIARAVQLDAQDQKQQQMHEPFRNNNTSISLPPGLPPLPPTMEQQQQQQHESHRNNNFNHSLPPGLPPLPQTMEQQHEPYRNNYSNTSLPPGLPPLPQTMESRILLPPPPPPPIDLPPPPVSLSLPRPPLSRPSEPLTKGNHFAQLALSMKNRFTSSTNNSHGSSNPMTIQQKYGGAGGDAVAPPVGLYQPDPRLAKPSTSAKQHDEPATTRVDEKKQTENFEVTRTIHTFVPHPLVCKRFGIRSHQKHDGKNPTSFFSTKAKRAQSREQDYFEKEVLVAAKQQPTSDLISPTALEQQQGAKTTQSKILPPLQEPNRNPTQEKRLEFDPSSHNNNNNQEGRPRLDLKHLKSIFEPPSESEDDTDLDSLEDDDNHATTTAPNKSGPPPRTDSDMGNANTQNVELSVGQTNRPSSFKDPSESRMVVFQGDKEMTLVERKAVHGHPAKSKDGSSSSSSSSSSSEEERKRKKHKKRKHRKRRRSQSPDSKDDNDDDDDRRRKHKRRRKKHKHRKKSSSRHKESSRHRSNKES